MAPGGEARSRLATERKNWRKDHPFGFVARPATLKDGSMDWMQWDCKIPGKPGTAWEGGLYPVTLIFKEAYPHSAPECRFPKGFQHPNAYPSGKICLSIINDEGWKPSITVKQILTGIHDLLNDPNMDDPAQEEAFLLLKKSPAEYRRRIQAQARLYKNSS
mmetsp:Transcript_10887/g.32620  ORF Transcript_10887/g.32620 Transcript_10887/m.32620 type:complete len:161 (-) Transcript_10887:556-1038(-)